MIVLHEAEAVRFDTVGLGVLRDATACTVTEERNGAYELKLQYPVTGSLFDQLQNRRLIYAPVNPDGQRQPFRIYKITKPFRGTVTVCAAHLTYDLSGVPLSPFSASNAAGAMQGLRQHSATAHLFEFWTDKSTQAAFAVRVPSSIRSMLGGTRGSILDVYGGEYEFDHLQVKLHSHRGADRGAEIRYGKNLTDLRQEENIQNAFTGVYPYWTKEDAYLELPEKILRVGTYGYDRIRPLDCSGEFEEKPTVEQLRSHAQAYMERNRIGIPKVALTVSFVPLEQSTEYAGMTQLTSVRLCDTVAVKFERLGVDARAKCIRTVFDCLKMRYQQIELGDARTNIADKIVAQGAELQRVADPSYLEAAVAGATALITGNKGGYVVLHSSTGGKEPDEILIMDQPSTKTAQKVWRWNQAGLGYSKNGYDGPYGLAMTMEGKIVADFIKSGSLDAAAVKVINLIADHVQSVAAGSAMEIDGAKLLLKTGNAVNIQLTNQFAGSPIMYMSDTSEETEGDRSEFSPHHLKIGGSSADPKFQVSMTGSAGQKRSSVKFDSLNPSGFGNCAWEFNAALGKTILVQKTGG